MKAAGGTEAFIMILRLEMMLHHPQGCQRELEDLLHAVIIIISLGAEATAQAGDPVSELWNIRGPRSSAGY